MISIEHVDNIAFIELNAPPVNALGLKMRQALCSAINDLESDDQIKAMVLCSALPLFCGGADIVEFRTGAVWDKPDLPELCIIFLCWAHGRFTETITTMRQSYT